MDFLSTFGTWCTPGAWHGTWHGSWTGGGWSGFLPFHLGPLMQIALVALVAYVIYRRFRTPAAATRRADQTPARETPEDILKRRYALGELDRETFERMKSDLG